MDALILSCGTGGGHNAAAQAVKEALEARGHHADLLNPYELLGGRAAQTINDAYIHMVQRAPWVFGCAYLAGEVYRRLPVRSPVYRANRAAEGVMESYLREHTYQVALATHVFPGMLMTRLKRRGVPVPPLILISTDYTCIPFFEEVECDYCVTPSENAIRRSPGAMATSVIRILRSGQRSDTSSFTLFFGKSIRFRR